MPSMEVIDVDEAVCICGHPALAHHGVDGRSRRDAGCQTRTMREDWCRCPLTATEALTALAKAGDPS